MAGGEQGRRLYVAWYHCVADNLGHAVTDEAFADGVARGNGRYRALCGHEIFIASCLVPLGRPCVACTELICRHNRPAVAAQSTPRHRMPSRWRRLLGCFQTPAVLSPRPPQRVRHLPEQGGRTNFPAEAGSAPILSVSAGHHILRGTR